MMDNQLQQSHEGSKISVWETAGPRVAKPLRVVDLPDELLMRIFELARDWDQVRRYDGSEPPPPFLGRPKSHDCIRNLRLTCTRFYNTSAHLLVDHVTVEMSPESLHRLEQISTHPSIKTGVREVQVMLHYYSALMAIDFYKFADECRTFLALCIRHASRLPEDREMLDKAVSVLKGWNQIADRTTPTNENAGEILKTSYEAYKVLWAAQAKVRNNSTFLGGLAAAFSRMQGARKLIISDQNELSLEGHRCLVKAVADGDEITLVRFLTCPLSWEDGKNKSLGNPPLKEFFEIPPALHSGGVTITSLHIYVPSTKALSSMVNAESIKNISAALQGLQYLEFTPQYSNDYSYTMTPYHTEPSKEFGNVFTTLCRSRDLKSLTLDFRFNWNSDNLHQTNPTFCAPNFKEFRPWQNLEHLKLLSVPIHQHELTHLVTQLPAPVEFRFDCVWLLSGTWMEMLDLLRVKAAPGSRITRLCGAEFGEPMSEEKRLVYQRIASGKAMQAYLRGDIDQNPLREVAGLKSLDAAEIDAMSTSFPQQ